MGVRAVSGKVSGKPAWQVCWTMRTVRFWAQYLSKQPFVHTLPQNHFGCKLAQRLSPTNCVKAERSGTLRVYEFIRVEAAPAPATLLAPPAP